MPQLYSVICTLIGKFTRLKICIAFGVEPCIDYILQGVLLTDLALPAWQKVSPQLLNLSIQVLEIGFHA